MELLRDVSEEIGGWQSVTVDHFTGVKGRFVQIMLVNGNHWITVSNLQCPANTVYIYDSMFSTIDNTTKEKICSIWRPATSYVHYRMLNIQHQTNSHDCGLFAIAVATELAYNRDLPGTYQK